MTKRRCGTLNESTIRRRNLNNKSRTVLYLETKVEGQRDDEESFILERQNRLARRPTQNEAVLTMMLFSAAPFADIYP